MLRALAAPVVWLLATLLLVWQQASKAAGAFLDAYNRGAIALGQAALRLGHRLVDWLGPLGQFLRALAAPVWRRLTAFWHWLNVKLLMHMFRPLRRFGRWVVKHAVPLMQRLANQLRQLVARLEPVLLRLTKGVEAVERAAARLAEGWRRLWAPVRLTVARWRRAGA